MVGGPASESDSDLRRRAAWLLGMLAVVAILLVIVMSQLMSSGGDSSAGNGPGALDSAVGPPPSHSSARTSRAVPARTSAAPTTSTSPAAGRLRCPTSQTCVLDGDPGNGIAAINLYRTQHGKDAVPGRVSTKAQQCALANGSGCSGGWAETELARADGAAAVQKILPFAHLLDSMSGFDVGWAYDPGAKLYYFAVIRNA